MNAVLTGGEGQLPVEADILQGSGNLMTEARPSPPIREIELACPAHVLVTFGDERHVTVTADDNVVPLIETSIVAGVLRVHPRERYVTTNQVTIQVMLKTLNRVSVTGPGVVDLRQPETEEMAIKVAGAGNVRAYGQGKLRHMIVNVVGAGTVRVSNLAVRSAEVAIEGPAVVEVRAKDRIAANVIAPGKLRVLGNPTRREVTGSGKITFS